MVPIDFSYATFYRLSIVTFALGRGPDQPSGGPYALHNAGAPLESSKPKRERGVGRGVPLPQPTIGVWGALYKLLSGVRGKAPAKNGFGEI